MYGARGTTSKTMVELLLIRMKVIFWVWVKLKQAPAYRGRGLPKRTTRFMYEYNHNNDAGHDVAVQSRW